jgi:uncharacterized membrane protein YbhN (UPF0104 family)
VNATTEVFQDRPDPDDSPPAGPRVARRRFRTLLLSGVVAVLLIGYALPHLLGTTAPSVIAALGRVSAADICLLGAIWALGLFTHSFALTSALPGLSRVRALMLNLTGSAVSNLLPFGGAAATTVNYRMARSWHVSVPAFAAFTLIANVWWIIVKLAMPLCAVVALSASGAMRSPALGTAAVASSVALAVVSLAMTMVARGHGTGVVRRAARVVAHVAARFGRSLSAHAVAELLAEARGLTAAIVASRWRTLCAGMVGYAILQAVLLGASLHAVGSDPTWPVVFGAYAVDRVLTLAVFMPGAAGVAELGVAAALVALGGAPATAAAGVLLYRGFTFGLEIPLGGAWLAGWIAARWLSRSRELSVTQRLSEDSVT